MKLTDELHNGKINLKTRLVYPPMATQSSESGVLGVRMIEHYTSVASNPLVGLIITEHSYVVKQGKADPHQMSFETDDVIPYQKNLTDTIHKINPNVKIFAQISHAGVSTSSVITGEPIVSASELESRNEISRALTIDEIKELEQKFADAALRVKKSGYDGVEIHSAHGYLLNQFYSPLTNFRDDEYDSQNIQNRLRFLVETVRLVRQTVGEDFPVAVRLGGCDYTEGGSTIEDSVQAAKILEKEGIDLLDISGGMCMFTRQGHREAGYFGDMTENIKKEINIPVILTGGIRTPEDAEKLLNENKADLIGVGRAMLRNPMWGCNRY